MEGETMSKMGGERNGTTKSSHPPPTSEAAAGASYRHPRQQQPPSSSSSSSSSRQHHHQRTASMESNNTHHSQPFAKMTYHEQQQHHQQQQQPSYNSGGHHYPPSHPQPYGSRGGGGGAAAGGYSTYHHSPSSSQGGHHYHHYQGGGGNSPHNNHHYSSRSIQPPVRSVVTRDSFSLEEDREDGPSRYSLGGHRQDNAGMGYGHPRGREYRSLPGSGDLHPNDPRLYIGGGQDAPPPQSTYGHGRDLPPVPEEGESRMPPHDMMRGEEMTRDGTTTTGAAGGGPPSTVRIPPSPHRGDDLSSPGSIHRTHSAHSTSSGPLKRSFWHHSRPVKDAPGGGGFEGTILPQEFMPPKRSKVGSSSNSRRSREYYVVARSSTGREDQQQQAFAPPPSPHHREAGMLPPPGPSAPGGGNGSTSNPNNNGGWINSNRSMSWDARDDYYRRDPRVGPSQSWSSRSPQTRDGPSSSGTSSPHWSEAPYMPSPRSRYGPSMDVGGGGGGGGGPSNGGLPYEASMNISRQNSWMSTSSHSSITGVAWVTPGHHRQSSAEIPTSGGPYPWSGPGGLVGGPHGRDEHKGPVPGGEGPGRDRYDHHNIGSSYSPYHGHHPYEGGPSSYGQGEPAMPYTLGQSAPSPSRKAKKSNTMEPLSTPRALAGKDGPIRLLSLPEDQVSLSETLCIVRQNIEVFIATLEDVEAPAPGRKHAVTVGQVGLRCIHCRHTTRSSERVKRAVCYPSSIKRIYRTVIDMKLDHFLHCKFVPQSLKDTLNALKANNTRSTGTTMQYFIRAASGMGMEDGPNGVRFVDGPLLPAPLVSPPPKKAPPASPPASAAKHEVPAAAPTMEVGQISPPIKRTASLSSDGTPIPFSPTSPEEPDNAPADFFQGEVSLALPEDKMSLSPLRCFLREQVCAFSATEEDIAVRTPTTFAVTVGQVGIGCIHCLHQPAKLRLNRAVCFPFSIGRIYQSVADIQRFHLNECKLVPQNVKDAFDELQSQSSKGSKGLATRQYWITSAKKIGLADTPKGIRFARDPNAPDQKAVSLDILAQVASHVTTVNRPLVLPEDKDLIAEFLYVVMDQLQACRFTEADRNKRRLKDVGCIGVECKHCAGQVDSRKFFWSSVNAVESNFVSVHTHMMECRMVPNELKERLGDLKKLRKEQTAALKTGSQKAFFARVWTRLHTKSEDEKASDGTEEKSPMHLTPMTSDDSNDRPVEETKAEPSPKSADSIEHMKAVTDNMAIVSV